eukprot:922006-Amorphochlora_amoeboformis.AAC.1
MRLETSTTGCISRPEHNPLGKPRRKNPVKHLGREDAIRCPAISDPAPHHITKFRGCSPWTARSTGASERENLSLMPSHLGSQRGGSEAEVKEISPTHRLLMGKGYVVHLVGTAHISSSSCSEVKRVIKETKPRAVMVQGIRAFV